MDQVGDSLCGDPTAHLSWQDTFGPASGFGMFGSEAKQFKLDFREFEWGAMAAAAGLAFLHWQTGPPTVTNNLRSLHAFCRNNESASSRGRDQKMRRHALKALLSCAEWYVQGWPRFEADLRRKGVEEEGDAAERQRVLQSLRQIAPELKRVLQEVQ